VNFPLYINQINLSKNEIIKKAIFLKTILPKEPIAFF